MTAAAIVLGTAVPASQQALAMSFRLPRQSHLNTEGARHSS